jgi:hypothetical protein
MDDTRLMQTSNSRCEGYSGTVGKAPRVKGANDAKIHPVRWGQCLACPTSPSRNYQVFA